MAKIDKNGVGYISASATKIKLEAFRGCTDLKSIVIPDKVSVIDEAAFFGCTGLTCIVIPAPVWEIEENAFLHCSCLRSITFLGSVGSIHKSAFEECGSLEQIRVPANKIEYYKMRLPVKLNKLIETNAL